jgi:hypothetical protein
MKTKTYLLLMFINYSVVSIIFILITKYNRELSEVVINTIFILTVIIFLFVIQMILLNIYLFKEKKLK